jgi:hypothetical protein
MISVEKEAKTKSTRSVIYIEMEKLDKHLLREIAKSKGLQLIPFCRMILLDYLKANK